MLKNDNIKIIYENEAIKNNAQLINSLGNKFLIVSGKTGAKKSGALDDFLEALKDKEYYLFDEIGENPKVETILKVNDFIDNYDCVVGIGGGSALDASKIIANLKYNKALNEEELFKQNFENERLPLILIGTTAGTGSEVNRVSVLTKMNGRKSSIRHDKLYGTIALCDPKYTYSLPLSIAKTTGVDALAHALESYFSNKATAESKEFATQAIELLLPALKNINNLSKEDKNNLYLGSLYGGLSINLTGTAFPHNVGYYLTENFNVPHGFACAIFEEDLLNYEEENNKEYFDEFIKTIKMGKDELISLINSLLPENNISISEETLKEILPRWQDNNSVKNTYGKMNINDIEKILRKKFL